MQFVSEFNIKIGQDYPKNKMAYFLRHGEVMVPGIAHESETQRKLNPYGEWLTIVPNMAYAAIFVNVKWCKYRQKTDKHELHKHTAT